MQQPKIVWVENNRLNMAMIRKIHAEQEANKPSELLLDFWDGFKLMSLVILAIACVLFIGTFFVLPPKGIFD